MKNKKVIALVVVLLVLLGLFYVSAGVHFNVEETEDNSERDALLDAFEISMSDFFEANIHTSLYLKDTFLEFDEMEIKIDQLIYGLQLEGEMKTIEGKENFDLFMTSETFGNTREGIFVNRISEPGYNQISVIALDKDEKVTVIILYSSELDGDKESYVIIDKIQNVRFEDVEIDKKINIELLKKYGSEIETTICLVGTFEGRLKEVEKQRMFKSLLNELDATVVENVLTDMYASATLYTPYIYETIELNKKRVNLQVAIRYNELENRTYIWIATPLIIYAY